MAKTIKYVIGIPKGETIQTKEFERFKSEHNLNEGNIDSWTYATSLTKGDFDILSEIFCSDQFREIRAIEGTKEELLDRIKKAINKEESLTYTIYWITRGTAVYGNGGISEPLHYYSKNVRHLDLSNISTGFIGELERVMEEYGIPKGANDAVNLFQESAKKRNLFVPVSYHYTLNGFGDLSYRTKVLVFIDDILEGEVTVKKTESYQDPWAGHTEKGKISIKVLGQEKEADWDSWQANTALRWIVDPVIRSEILGEKSLVFTEL